MEQYLYMITIINIFTKEHYIKLGYSANIEQRIKQLEKGNKYFEIQSIKLYRHKTKNIGYFFDEQIIHNENATNRTRFTKDVMPLGRTECYESFYCHELLSSLSRLGYICVFDTDEEANEPMFVWA